MTAEQLISLRKTLGLNQTEFAQALNQSFATVNRWENGHREIPAEVARLLDCLQELVDKASQRKSKITVDEVSEAVRSTGIVSVVTQAGAAGIISNGLLMSLAVLPAFLWLGGVLGLTAAVALPFFTKLGAKKNSSSQR